MDLRSIAPPLLLLLLFRGAVFRRLAQVHDRLHAFGLQLLEVLWARLAARAELRVHLHEISYRRKLGPCGLGLLREDGRAGQEGDRHEKPADAHGRGSGYIQSSS
jgi:hypothetical protein